MSIRSWCLFCCVPKSRLFARLTCLVLVVGWTSARAQSALTFTTAATLPNGGRYGMGYCQEQRYFYMVGGGSPLTTYTRELFRYDTQTNS